MDFNLYVEIQNLGEDAYLASMKLYFPSGIHFIGIRILQGVSTEAR